MHTNEVERMSGNSFKFIQMKFKCCLAILGVAIVLKPSYNKIFTTKCIKFPLMHSTSLMHTMLPVTRCITLAPSPTTEFQKSNYTNVLGSF